jgi:N,N'-diacetyllegionaminate synthase
MRIGRIDLDERILIVAEIGNNHEGSLERARELVLSARECGADGVKFQTIRPGLLVRPTDRARLEQLSRFELPIEAFAELSELAHANGLLFLSTPFDIESAGALEPLLDAYKVASGDNDFFPLLDRIARTGKPLIVSSGMAEIGEILRTKEFVEEAWRSAGIAGELAVLHCVSAYPTPPESASLAAIPILRETLGCTIGYSDHTIGVDACTAAAALGARILEKHFTLDHQLSEFRDHVLSADPSQLRDLVTRIRVVEVLLGRPEKAVGKDEHATAAAARRSIVAAADLPRGHVLRPEDLTWLRPRDGLAPGQEMLLLERRLTRDVAHGESIVTADVE